ncbi:3518_t:CDS:2 [Gigaspora rosea]|nr:3518_t:CDS:2 [Gigaspora rosea]
MCKAQICHYGKKSDDDVPSYFIGCSAWAAEDKHTHHQINKNEIDIIILEKLFKGKSLVPLDLKITLFVVLICKGIHSHPAPSPVNIPTGIQINLEHIINEATQTFERVTPKKILSSNLLKAHFGKDLYTEIHASLNNLDKLRYLVNKAQQKQFPFEQGLLGIATEF